MQKFIVGSKVVCEIEFWEEVKADSLEGAIAQAKETSKQVTDFSIKSDKEEGPCFSVSSKMLSIEAVTDGEAFSVKHEGIRPYRKETNPAEEIYAQKWEEFAKRHLSDLLSLEQDGVEVSQYQATIAATVVQWLGSPVGQEFVRECQEKIKAID